MRLAGRDMAFSGEGRFLVSIGGVLFILGILTIIPGMIVKVITQISISTLRRNVFRSKEKEEAVRAYLIKYLKKRAYKADSDKGAIAIRILSKRSNGNLVDFFIRFYREGNHSNEIKLAILNALEKTADTRAVELLIEVLKDNDYEVQKKAIEALKTIKDYRAIEPLTRLRNEENDNIREEAKSALTYITLHISDPRAMEPLIKCLKDKDKNVRIIAAVGLRNFRDTAIIEPLIEALNDEKMTVWVDVETTLKKVTGEKIDGREKWQEWWQENKEKLLKKK